MICFEIAFVNGYKRVPDPQAKIIPFIFHPPKKFILSLFGKTQTSSIIRPTDGTAICAIIIFPDTYLHNISDNHHW